MILSLVGNFFLGVYMTTINGSPASVPFVKLLEFSEENVLMWSSILTGVF